MKNVIKKHLEPIVDGNSDAFYSALLSHSETDFVFKMAESAAEKKRSDRMDQFYSLFDQGIITKDQWVALISSVDWWLREPAEWQPHGATPEENYASLLTHLFVVYPVPDVLLNERFKDKKWRDFLVIMGRGGSLRRAARFFDWTIPKKLPALLFDVPREFSALEACQWAEIYRLGGNMRDFSRMQNLCGRLDLTSNEPESSADRDFWQRTAHWLIKNRDDLKEDQWEIIRDWAYHQQIEAEKKGQRFSWKNRTPASACRAATDYAVQKIVVRKQTTWPAHGWDWQLAAEGLSIKELTNAEELYLEAKALNHCVWRYVDQCLQGGIAIFSLKLNNAPQLTIEVDLNSREIVQARGYRNRLVDEKEKEILRLWTKNVVNGTN